MSLWGPTRATCQNLNRRCGSIIAPGVWGLSSLDYELWVAPSAPPPRFSARGHWVLAIGAPLSLPSDQINHSNLAVLTAV